MKTALPVLILLLFSSCKNTIVKEDLSLLNGYWEIEKVSFPNGESKDYTVNTTIDFIKIDDVKGFRKKLRPKFDGTYDATDDAVLFSIHETDGLFSMHYTNSFERWKEDLVELQENSFTTMNEESVLYTYKRYQPINSTP
ncbi:hypothetical protein [Spongiimicrobium salis]|uniref:hypothetical protein n=1 Tax=Spongiimicrobium salis TaxID=1667022 RepID=UPI00374D97EA